MNTRYLSAILCATIITLTLFTTVAPPAHALSKSFTKDFVVSSGKSTYTFTLSSPDEMPNKSNWTITTTLVVDHMDRYKTFVFFSSIILTVETSNGKTLKKSLQFGHYPISEFPDRLYPGGKWGPTNTTINLAEEGLEAPFGGALDADIYATVNIAEFLFQPFRPEQLPLTTYETFSVNVGSVKIVSGDSLPSYLPYILGLIMSVTIFTGLVVRDRFIGRRRSS